MSPPGYADSYCSLADHVSLKLLEKPSLYNRDKDDLFNLDAGGLAALLRCDGSRTVAGAGLTPDFLNTCVEEGLLELQDRPFLKVPALFGPSPTPSLRYLEVQLTWRCNLACAHCYLGEARAVDLPLSLFASVIREFEHMGGLKLMVSGGEPTLHPAWEEVNALLAGINLRRVLLTNGVNLGKIPLEWLNFDEVQISLDGMEQGHDLLRGKGSFIKALGGARRVAASPLALSIATQVHGGNLGEFEALEALARDLGAREWGIDAPCVAGRLTGDSPLSVSAEAAGKAMGHAFGGSYHGGGEGMACGLHLATVGANGLVAQCGFYFDDPLGRSEEGLAACWARRRPVPLSDLPSCARCEAASDCGGGCRVRAGGGGLPDKVMCAAMGVEPPAG